jgi:hypothetical protein
MHADSVQSIPPWVPALAADTIRPPHDANAPAHHEPLLNVKAVETGVIDVSPDEDLDEVVAWLMGPSGSSD